MSNLEIVASYLGCDGELNPGRKLVKGGKSTQLRNPSFPDCHVLSRVVPTGSNIIDTRAIIATHGEMLIPYPFFEQAYIFPALN